MDYGLPPLAQSTDENIVEYSTFPLTVPEHSPTGSGSSIEETSPVLWYGHRLASTPRPIHRPLPFNLEFDSLPIVATQPAPLIYASSANALGNALGLSYPVTTTTALLNLGQNTFTTLNSAHPSWLNTLPITNGAPADLMGPDPTLPRDDKHMLLHGSLPLSTVSSSTSSSASSKLPLSSSPGPAPTEFEESFLPAVDSMVDSDGDFNGEDMGSGDKKQTGQEKHFKGEEKPLSKKKRTRAGRACECCKRRKCRCDEDVPCGHCRHLNWECVYVDTPRSRGRNKASKRAASREVIDDDRAQKKQRTQSSSSAVAPAITKPKVSKQRSTIPSAPKPRGRKPNRVKDEMTSPIRDLKILSPKAAHQSYDGFPTPAHEPQSQQPQTWGIATPFAYNNGPIDNGNALGFVPNGPDGISSWNSNDNQGLGLYFGDSAHSNSSLFRPGPTISYDNQQQQRQQRFDIAGNSNTYAPRRPIPMYDYKYNSQPTSVNHNYSMGYAYPTPETTPQSVFQSMSGVDHNGQYLTPGANGNGWWLEQLPFNR